MGHVRDQWTRPGEIPPGKRKPKRIRTDRWGRGKRWLACWQENGRERTKAFATQDAAELHVSQIDAGVVPIMRSGGPTVAVWAEQWQAAQLHHRSQTQDSTGRSVRRVIRAIGDRRLSDLSRADIQQVVSDWSETLAPSTVHVTYSALTSMLKMAVIDELIPALPTVGVKLPRIVRDKVVPLTLEQATLIAERMPAHYRAMVWLGVASGMRGGELRGLTEDRIAGTAVRVDRQLVERNGKTPIFGPPKSAAGVRSIDIGQAAMARLVDHMAAHGRGGQGLVFTTRTGAPLRRADLSDVWRAATSGMKLRDRSGWHDLRHYHASLLIAEGLSPRAVADRLGHEDPSETLRTYAHLWPSDQARSVSAVEAAFCSVPARSEDPTGG